MVNADIAGEPKSRKVIKIEYYEYAGKTNGLTIILNAAGPVLVSIQ